MTTDLYAYLGYRDAARGLRWLEALGFEVLTRQDAEDGGVVHAEVRLGGAVLMISSDLDAPAPPPLRDTSTGNGLYLRVEDVDALFDRAVAAGATPVIPPEATEWGSRRARVLDPEGHEWSLGTYAPGAAW